ncbi:MAG: hypothetical protein KDI74_03010 [Gammaproteobacteria bacterium]|nr:hypothetical protein [Gammaproteobacteria bacterium]
MSAFLASEVPREVLALSTTLAGNLLIIGTIANIIAGGGMVAAARHQDIFVNALSRLRSQTPRLFPRREKAH